MAEGSAPEAFGLVYVDPQWQCTFEAELGKLDAEQRAIVEAVAAPGREPLLIVAGAGSGKTATTVVSIANLLFHDIVPPSDIILTTFTVKAREEMEGRLRSMVDPRKWKALRVGTFHALALRYLRVHDPQMPAHRWDNARNLDVVPAGKDALPTATTLWAKLLDDWEIPGLGVKGLDVLKGHRKPRDYSSAVEVLRSKGWTVDSPKAQLELQRLRLELPCIADAWRLYEQAKAHFKAFDFADALEVYWRRGKDKAVRVFVDECQDNNKVQLSLAQDLARRGRGRLVLIGDVRQAIFGFHGAAPEIVAGAESAIGAKLLEITSNYRSGDSIVQLGNRIARDKTWAFGSASKSVRLETDGTPVQGRLLARGYGSALEEAQETAKQVKALLAAGQSPKEIAVLTRTNAAGAAYEVGFIQAQVPVLILGAPCSFFERADVKCAVAFCQLAEGSLTGAAAVAAVMRIWRVPVRRKKPFHFLGEQRFREAVEQVVDPCVGLMGTQIVGRLLKDTGLWRTRSGGVDPEWQVDAAALLGQLKAIEAATWPKRMYVIAELMVDPPLVKAPDSKRKRAATGDSDTDQDRMYALCGIADAYPTLGALLTFTQQIVNQAVFLDNADREHFKRNREQRVIVSTVHKSKGLGFETVFISATAGFFPSSRVQNREEADEEERIFYVAATRPKRTAVFTWWQAEDADGDIEGGPSPFIDAWVRPAIEEAEKAEKLAAEEAVKAAQRAELEVLAIDGWTLTECWLPADSMVQFSRPDGWTLDVSAESAAAPAVWTVEVRRGRSSPVERVYTGSGSTGTTPDPDALVAARFFMFTNPESFDRDPAEVKFEAFRAYVETLPGDAVPGLTWREYARKLMSDTALRGAVISEIERDTQGAPRLVEGNGATGAGAEVVVGPIEGPPTGAALAEAVDRVLGPSSHEIVERAPVWVSLPEYPAMKDRSGSASLVADSRWLSVSRPWRAGDPRTLLLTGSIVVLDFPSGFTADWKAYRIEADGGVSLIAETLVQGMTHSAVQEAHTRFQQTVAREKRAYWKTDPLTLWCHERSLPEALGRDARYVFEGAAGQPIVVKGGRLEAVGVEIDRRGKLGNRAMLDIDEPRLDALVAAGLLMKEATKVGAQYRSLVGSTVAVPVPTDLKPATDGPVAAVEPKKRKK